MRHIKKIFMIIFVTIASICTMLTSSNAYTYQSEYYYSVINSDQIDTNLLENVYRDYEENGRGLYCDLLTMAAKDNIDAYYSFDARKVVAQNQDFTTWFKPGDPDWHYRSQICLVGHPGCSCISPGKHSSPVYVQVATIMDISTDDGSITTYNIEDNSSKVNVVKINAEEANTNEKKNLINIAKNMAYFSYKSNSYNNVDYDLMQMYSQALAYYTVKNVTGSDSNRALLGMANSLKPSQGDEQEVDFESYKKAKELMKNEWNGADNTYCYGARLLFLKCTKDLESERTEGGNTGQNGLIFAGRKGEVKGNLIIKKVDKDTKNLQAGVKFKITGPSFLSGATYTTDEEGKIYIPNIKKGSYTIKEIEHPIFGYTIMPEKTIKVKAMQTVEVEIENEKQTGRLQIIKQDKDNSKNKLEGVQFKLKKYDTNSKTYKYVRLNDTNKIIGTATVEKEAITDMNNATVLETNSSGKVDLQNILIGSYEIEENYAGDIYGYDTSHTYWDNSSTPSSKKQINIARQKSNNLDEQITVTTANNQKQTGSLIINKKDKDTNTNLNGVQFRLKQGNDYIRLNNSNNLLGTQRITSLTKTTNVSQATTLTTAGGQIKLVNLLVGTYQLEEISVGNNYGYTVNSTKTKVDGDYIYINNSNTPVGNSSGKHKTIDVTVTRQTSTETNNNNSTEADSMNVYNRRKYIKLSGNVWEDMKPIGKGTDFNNIFGNEDVKLQNIKVTLKNSDGTNVEKIETESTFTNPTYTNSNGYYSFEDVLINNLNRYYLEFEYDGEIYTTTKSFNELGQNNSNAEANTSKAQEIDSQRTTLDNNYNNVEGTSNESQSRVNNRFNVNYNLTRNENADTTAKSKNIAIFEGQLSGSVRNVNKFDGYENYDAINKITSTTKETGYGVLGGDTADRIRKSGKTELSNRNCGLVQREQVDLSTSTDLENVIVKVNGYTNTYMYGKSNSFKGTVEDQYGNIVSGPEDEYRLDVKGQKWGYFRKMYASDIVYNGTDSCEVYLTYGITVRNNSNSLKAKVTNLANYHDSRYTIVKTGLDENMTDSVEATWTGKGDLGNGYTVEYTSALPDIPAIGTRKIFVQYKLDTSAVVSILSGDISLNDVVEINGYTTYYGANTYYHTGNETRTGIYASIDRNSAPGNITLGNNTTYEDDTMQAPAVTMQLTTNERSIEGNVFEDMPEAFNGEANEHEVYSGQERIGNGLYEQEKDNNVGNVTVELFDFDVSKQPNAESNNRAIWTESIGSLSSMWVSNLPAGRKIGEFTQLSNEIDQRYNGTYETDATKSNKEAIANGYKIPAQVKTDSSGHYKIYGVVPGRYVLKFTYGDGSVIYKDSTEVKTLDRADYYKSTIVTSEIIRAELEKNPKVSSMWYKTTENAGRTSDAVDDLSSYNSSNSSDVAIRERVITHSNQNEVKINKKSAYTAPMNIKFENMNTEANSDENGVSTTEHVDADGEKVLKINSDGTQQVETVLRYNTQNIDFGIIENAKQDYQIQKEITNIKVTLANGQVLIDGNPSQNLQYVKYLEHTPFNRSNTINMEIDNELIVGATLEVTYQVEAINESELNYLTYDYYYFGIPGEEKGIETLSISKIIDYFDNDLVYDSFNTTNNIIIAKVDSAGNIVAKDGTTIGNAKDYLKNPESAKKYDYLLILEGEEKLTPNSSEKWSYKASRVLTTSDELEFDNNAESIEVKTSMPPSTINELGSIDPKDKNTFKANETDFFGEQIAITSPTGENRDYSIYIIGTAVLAILSLGIVIIKKKAL